MIAVDNPQSRRAPGRGAGRSAGPARAARCSPAGPLCCRTPGDVEDQARRGEGHHQARPAVGDEGQRDPGERGEAEDGEQVQGGLREDQGSESRGEELAEAVAGAVCGAQARVAEHAEQPDQDEEADEPELLANHRGDMSV